MHLSNTQPALNMGLVTGQASVEEILLGEETEMRELRERQDGLLWVAGKTS